ncbi:MAG: hypothetical protein Q7K55_08745 [Candidatus Levybacteria bacterium]|nr:hypothetical protein [Candidatus Levybacteria bacterium]
MHIEQEVERQKPLGLVRTFKELLKFQEENKIIIAGVWNNYPNSNPDTQRIIIAINPLKSLLGEVPNNEFTAKLNETIGAEFRPHKIKRKAVQASGLFLKELIGQRPSAVEDAEVKYLESIKFPLDEDKSLRQGQKIREIIIWVYPTAELATSAADHIGEAKMSKFLLKGEMLDYSTPYDPRKPS